MTKRLKMAINDDKQPPMIEVTINGESKQVPEQQTISSLLDCVGIPGPYLAVEVNQDVVPRELHDTTLVAAGDQIEVVTLVGGG